MSESAIMSGSVSLISSTRALTSSYVGLVMADGVELEVVAATFVEPRRDSETETTEEGFFDVFRTFNVEFAKVAASIENRDQISATTK